MQKSQDSLEYIVRSLIEGLARLSDMVGIDLNKVAFHVIKGIHEMVSGGMFS